MCITALESTACPLQGTPCLGLSMTATVSPGMAALPRTTLKRNSAYSKWLGHPPVHVSMKCLPQRGAPRIPADFWMEREETYIA